MDRKWVDGHGWCEVWSLPKVSPKKQRRGKYIQESFVHPAKMGVVLCRKIIETYTKLGEIVLDPMSGIGTTLVEAALMGRDAIGVELEQPFVGTTQKNIELIERTQTMTPKGKAVIIQGDSRELSKILGEKVDVAVFSPPFAQAQRGGGIAQKGYDGPKHGPTDLVGKRSYMPENVGGAEGNISNMPYGEVDAIITSPPYSEGTGHGGGRAEVFKVEKRLYLHGKGSYSDGNENIGHLKHGQIDTIVTSPPYHDNKSDWDRKSRAAKEGEDIAYSDEVGRERKNIGNIHYYDRGEPLSHKYSKAPKGKETYLSAMLKVYAECFEVLKSGGRMVLVIKDFVRNKKVVRLDLDTKRLCEVAGFRWVETKLFKLPSKSFWRVIYEKKYPEVDTSLVGYEFVEVFEKQVGAGSLLGYTS